MEIQFIWKVNIENESVKLDISGLIQARERFENLMLSKWQECLWSEVKSNIS